MLNCFTKFIRTLTFFILPLLVFYILIYVYATTYPSVFKKKADYLNAHAGEVEVVFLGSSHAQYAVNPRLIDKKSLSVAYGGQTIRLYKMIFDRYASEMKNLKYLMIELDYFTLEHFTGNEEYRQPLYHTFYGIASGNDSFLSKYIFSFDDLKFFTQSMALEALSFIKNKDYQVNEWGFIESNVNYAFYDLNYNEGLIEETADSRIIGSHVMTSIQNYRVNTALIDSILLYCSQNNIRPIIVSYPVYKTYLKREIAIKKQRRLKYIDKIKAQYPNLLYWDFEQNTQMKVQDFWDDGHLDVSGAEKLSAIINQKLNELN